MKYALFNLFICSLLTNQAKPYPIILLFNIFTYFLALGNCITSEFNTLDTQKGKIKFPTKTALNKFSQL